MDCCGDKVKELTTKCHGPQSKQKKVISKQELLQRLSELEKRFLLLEEELLRSELEDSGDLL